MYFRKRGRLSRASPWSRLVTSTALLRHELRVRVDTRWLTSQPFLQHFPCGLKLFASVLFSLGREKARLESLASVGRARLVRRYPCSLSLVPTHPSTRKHSSPPFVH